MTEGFRKDLSREELLDLIRRAPSSLEGQMESQWLEFKKEPHLKPDGKTEDRHRFELAKDVTAMANAGGGILVWGVAEVRDQDEARRHIGMLSPLQPGIVDGSQVRKTLREWVFPTSLDVNVLERQLQGGGSVWILDIPPPPPESLPFLVVREWPPAGKGERAVRGHFTMYRRSGTDNVHVPPEEVYQWLRMGFQDVYGAQKLRGLESGAKQPSGAILAIPSDDALAEELEALGVQEGSLYYFVQFAPSGGGRLRDFFGTGADALQSRLARVEKLRDAGFSCFSRYASPERTPSNGLRLGLNRKGGVYVLATGVTTLVCCQDTLTWASERNAPDGKLLINPIALPEFTVEACRFFLKEVMPRWQGSIAGRAFQWRVGMRGLGGRVPVHLPKGRFSDVPLRVFWEEDEPHTAIDFGTNFASTLEDDPDRLAFVILEEVFHHFGYPAQAIPFQIEGKVDAQAIASL